MLLCSIILLAGAQGRPQFTHFGEGAYGPYDRIQVYGNFPNDADLYEGSFFAYLFRTDRSPTGEHRIPLSCEDETIDTFENGDVLPLTQQMYFEKYLSCEMPEMVMDAGATYGFIFGAENEDAEDEYSEDVYSEFNFLFDNTLPDKANIADDHYGRKTLWRNDYSDAIQKGLVDGRERSGKPKITGIHPRHASPLGGCLITISGQNLRSNELDLGAGNKDETEGQGLNIQMYFERHGVKVPCDFDGMNMLHGDSMEGLDYLICNSRPTPEWTHYWIRVVIDGKTYYGDHVYFHENYAPTHTVFYPQNAAPAKPLKSYDLANTYWTEWYDLDTEDTTVEDESLIRHMLHDPATFIRCANPIDMYVEDKSTGMQFQASTEQNADGLAEPVYNNVRQGFKCEDEAQTKNPETDELLAKCSDVRVRYECMDSVIEMKGRIYTDVHGRAEDPDFFVNRLMEYPKIVNEKDKMKGECQVHVNDGTPEECGDHANCGRNRKFQFKKISKNDGVIQFQPAMAIPGSYNFTYQTFHNGNSVGNKQLRNYMASDMMEQNDFEIFPQILSVYPQQGKASGGALLTIKGTGFIEDGIGGKVDVMVGNDACEVVSQSETEIICKTSGGKHSDSPWWEAYPFTSLQGHELKWSRLKHDGISADECREKCKTDAACLAFSWNDNKCKTSDFIGINDEANLQHFDASDSAVAGYRKFSDRPEETTCFTGRGEKYQGNIAVDQDGVQCKAGTFCRTEGEDVGENNVRPSCTNEDDKVVFCNVVKCDQVFGKFVGNRGMKVSVMRRDFSTYLRDSYWRTGEVRKEDDFKTLIASFSPGKLGGFYSQSDKLDHYTTRMRAHFVAPYDGVFGFLGRVDDRMFMTTNFGDDGSFITQFENPSHCHSYDKFCPSGPARTKDTFTLKKGETVQIQTLSSEGNGGDHQSIGAQHFGPDGTGTWVDQRSKKEFLGLDNYVYGDQDLWTYKEFPDYHQIQDYIWFTFKYDDKFVERRNELEDPEDYSSREMGLFRLQWCGSVNGKENKDNCWTTENLDVRRISHRDLEAALKPFEKTECDPDKAKGKFSTTIYHGTYEDKEPWPSTGHFRQGAGAWCGNEAHEVHNHDIWNSHVGIVNSKAKSFTSKQADDICFAFKGRIDKLYYALSFNWVDENGKQHKHRDWFKPEVDWQSDDWTWKCFKITDTMAKLDGVVSQLSTMTGDFFDITNIRLWNAISEPIYIDELHIGRVTRTPFEVVQTKLALTFDGQQAYDFDAWKQNHGNGVHFRLRVDTWNDITKCGYHVPLPTILPPDGDKVEIYSNTRSTSGSDWRRFKIPQINKVYDGLYDGWIPWAIEKATERGIHDFKFMELNTKTTDDDDVFVNEFDVMITRQGKMDDNYNNDVIIRYGDSADVLKVRVNQDLSSGDMQEKMRETWPELEKIDMRVYREGWCNAGYKWNLISYEHGPMKDFSVEPDPRGHQQKWIYMPKYGVDVISRPSAYTHILPGSVIATDHHVPQVVVIANGQRSACDSCDFVYRSDLEASVESIFSADQKIDADSSNFIQEGKPFEFTVNYNLNGFEGDLTLMTIYIGDTMCVLSDQTYTSSKCHLAKIGEGDHKVIMTLPHTGPLELNGVLIKIKATLDNNTPVPSKGSVFGGTVVKYTGIGFTSGMKLTMPSPINAHDDVNTCDSAGFDVSFTEFKCRTSPVAENDVDKNNIGSSPYIMAFGFVVQDDIKMVSITGVNLKNDGCKSKIHYGDIIFEEGKSKITWTDSMILFKAPAHAPGKTKVFVDVCASDTGKVKQAGYSNQKEADLNPLGIKKVYSRGKTHHESVFSSLMGGLELTLQGPNIATGSFNGKVNAKGKNVAVKVGELPCEIKEINHNHDGDDTVVCITAENTKEVYLVLVGGKWVYGDKEGPAKTGQDASEIEIEEGQFVNWSWNIQLDGITPTVQFKQGKSKWSEEIEGNQGTFRKQFTRRGTYAYTTGEVDGKSEEYEFKGKLKVIYATDKPYRIKLTLGHNEIEHQSSNKVEQPSNCDIVPNRQTTSAEKPSEKGFYVVYSWLTTPKVLQWQVKSSRHDLLDGYPEIKEREDNEHSPVGEIEVRYEHSDMRNCKKHFTIMIGDIDCYKLCKENRGKNCEDADDNTRRRCHLGDLLGAVEIDTGKTYRLRAVAIPMGYAEQGFKDDESNYVQFVPHVKDSTPKEFSRYGAIDMEFNGAGFNEKQQVIFKGETNTDLKREIKCDIKEISYTQIKCRLPYFGSFNEENDLVGYIRSNGRDTRTDSSDYEAEKSKTPKVQEVTPNDANDILVVKGKNLVGVTVNIGNDHQCREIKNADDESFECVVPQMAAGIYWLSFNAGTLGGVHIDAEDSEEDPFVGFKYTASFSVTNLDPIQVGWGTGGKRVTISGSGLSMDNRITVRDADTQVVIRDFCRILEASLDQLVIEMPMTSSAKVQIIVAHEYISGEFFIAATYDGVDPNLTPMWNENKLSSDVTGISADIATFGVKPLETDDVVSNFGDCENTKLEIGFHSDPCAQGAHYCPELATCTPHGNTYSCSCPGNDENWDGEVSDPFGNGQECFLMRNSDGKVTEDGISDRCEEQWENTGYTMASIKTGAADFKPNLKNIMMFINRFHDGRHDFDWYFFKLNDEIRCAKLLNCTESTCSGSGEFKLGNRELSLVEKNKCKDFGREGRVQMKKHAICVNRQSQICHGDSDVGRYTYSGLRTTTITGRKCRNWKEAENIWKHMKNYPETMNFNVPNRCHNTWNSAEGPYCVVETYGEDGHYVTETCGIPACSAIGKKPMQQCTIQSAAPIDNAYIWRRNDSDLFDSSVGCYLGSSSHSFMTNPRRCNQRSRYPLQWVLHPYDLSENAYKISYAGEKDARKHFIKVDVKKKQDQRVTKVETTKDDASVIHVYPVEGKKNTFTLRHHDHFLAAPSGKVGHYMHTAHESELHNYEPNELEWIIKCTSDNYGSIHTPPEPAFKQVATVKPTNFGDSGECTKDNTYVYQMPDIEAGSYSVVVRTLNGLSRGQVDIEIPLKVNNITPENIGGGGNVAIQISGSGFTERTKAFLCGKALVHKSVEISDTPGVDSILHVESMPYTDDDCLGNEFYITSINPANGEELRYPSLDQVRKRRDNGDSGVGVSSGLTPKITGVSPKMGGTAGGTHVTITGTNFGTNVDVTTVTIFDVDCTVISVAEDSIVCETGIFKRVTDTGHIIEQVPVKPVVTINDEHGRAEYDDSDDSDLTFWYIDRWSSPYTWGCSDETCLPQVGEIIVIPKGQIILLDITTPVLAVLLLDGGHLIWDRKDGIELHMQYGIVNAGGSFTLGTEEEPFCPHKATIIMYGHQRTINLPIYGAKVLAVRSGHIDIHGCRKTTTWTEMAVTAEAGDDEIYLTHPVHEDWLVDDYVIVAATGDLTNFHRSEKMQIAAVASTEEPGKGYKVTFTESLKHRHIAVCSNGPGNNGVGWGWAGEICTRAEVGLLTRNVKMMGNVNQAWEEELPECKLGIGTAFGVQTCFQNRFGHETGSDQFGSVLFLHKVTYAKIEFAEFTHAGQAFNLARYPIHFHVPGSLPTSYVRGCGIHNTFNRAMTMHGVHDLTVEFNVVYNIMGLAFFLEDAVEERNTLRYNLGVMNKKSSSLLNVDSTPAVFWIPNPNNIFYGNRAAGSSHFGYWFNPPDRPTGPSGREPEYQNFCVKNRPLGQFYNNTAHSMGKYGLWIFTDLTPTGPDGVCGETTPKANKFGFVPEKDENGLDIPKNTFGFFAWHCERGAEIATGGALQFHNMIAANNWIAGLAGKETFLHTFADDGAEDQSQLFKRNIVIGHLDGDRELEACGDMGIETPWKFFAFTVDDIHFFNFDIPTPEKASVDLKTFGMRGELSKRRCVAIDPCYGTNAFDCGAITRYSNVKWYQSDRKTCFSWEHEAALYDKDGSLLNMGPGHYVIAKSPSYDPSVCSDETTGRYDVSGTTFGSSARSHPAMVCKETGRDGQHFKPHRFMFNQAKPSSMEGTVVSFTNDHGAAKSPFRNCRPRGKGWMVLLDGNQEYTMTFTQHDHISNISYAGDIDDFEQEEWLTIKHDFPEKIDYAKINGVESLREPWPANALDADTYDYNIHNTSQPYTVKYTFNGKEATANPDMKTNEYGQSMTLGLDFPISPDFYKCFYVDCISPEPEGFEEQPALESCNFLDCADIPQLDFDKMVVKDSQHMVIDAAAMAAKGNHFKFTRVIVDGTLDIPASSFSAGDNLIIEADSLVVNTGGGNNEDKLSLRRKRDTAYYNNGKIIIGTAENPIPCDVTVTIKINGDKFSSSYGAFPGSIPIGQKALGGMGGIEIHGCPISKTFSTLKVTVENTASIQLNDDVQAAGWKKGDDIVIATTDFEHRHTEYFSIKEINGATILLNKAVKWRHLGSETTTQTVLGREIDQAAEVALLTRNIKIDGSEGAEGKVGGRIVVIDHSEQLKGHDYVRAGYGQFSFVELKGMGAFGYNEFDDLRAQILFWGVKTSADEEKGRKASYVKGCSFHGGFNTAVAAMSGSNDLVVDNNVVFGCVDSAIRTDSTGLQITNNLLGNIYQFQLWENYVESIQNTNFADDQMPAGIMTEETDNVVITGNRVAGVDGSCFSGFAEACSKDEVDNDVSTKGTWQNNIGHGCLRGYYNFRKGFSQCSRVSGFYFYKIRYYGVTMSARTQYYIIDNTIIHDAVVGFYANPNGPDPVKHIFQDKKMVVKNSQFTGRTASYDCEYDETVRKDMYATKFCGRQQPNTHSSVGHTALIAADFIAGSSGFPACAWDAHDVNAAMYGLTLIYNTEFKGYNRKCSNVDTLILTNKNSWDHVFPVKFTRGNKLTDVNSADIARFHQGQIGRVNIADCVDLFCDGFKKFIVVDEEGSVLGGSGATLLPESEYEWDDHTNPNGETYVDTRDGLGDYRVPKPMMTTLTGGKIPFKDVYQGLGIHRSTDCKWVPDLPGWNCPRDNLKYEDLIFESMDADHERRRLTPLAVRSNTPTKYLDIVNGPGDHSCCIGYACQIRLMTMHSLVACGNHYDYYFTSTTPMSMRFHFPYAPTSCKIIISMYTKRPNRLDVSTLNAAKEKTLIPPTNGNLVAGKMTWDKPNIGIHMPSLSDVSGANFHERDNQMMHMVFQGGTVYEVNVVETLILELGVMTELSNDEFYDNGNLANNLAALLGISKDKIRIMNVIKEDGNRRRRRRRALGFKVIHSRYARNTDKETTSLQFEIEPEADNEAGKAALAETGKTIVNKADSIVEESTKTIKNDMGDTTAQVDKNVAMATPPKQPPKPPPAVTLAQTLNMAEIEPGEDIAAFVQKVQENLPKGVALTDIKPAAEREKERQAAADKAMEPVVRKVPAEMVFAETDGQPTGRQILNANLFGKFTIQMKDSDGEFLETVGVDPWIVTIKMIDLVMKDKENPVQPSMEGKTSTEFPIGDGRAIFDNIMVTGDLVSCKFEFSVRSDEGEVAPLVSNMVEFLPAVPRGPCEEREGGAFDKKESWSATCDFVCQAPCVDLSGLVAIKPDCYNAGICTADKWAKCSDSGCDCDKSLEAPSTDYRKYLTTHCSPTEMTLRMPKCVMNRLSDMRLKDLSVHGEVLGKDRLLSVSAKNNCKGKVDYREGPEYVFNIAFDDENPSDCKTIVTSSGGSTTRKNIVQGYPTAKANIFVEFGCKCEGDSCFALPLKLPEINECETGAHNCHTAAICHDLPNSSATGYECKCAKGFEGDGVEACTDIDECAKDPNICDTETSTCQNTPGGYECLCKPGQDCSTGPCPSSKCWSFDETTFECTMRESCLDLTCGSQTIDIEFDVKLFGKRDAYENVVFNIGDKSDVQVPEIDSSASKWSLSCPIGECGMTWMKDTENNLVFVIPVTQTGSQRQRVDSDLKPHQIELAGGLTVNTSPHAADVTFKCKYPMTIDLESSEFSVTNVAIDGRTVGAAAGKFDFAMKLNDGANYSENILGSPLKVEVGWTLESFSGASFYFSTCTVHQSDQSVALVINGCYASKLGVAPITQTNRVMSFSFNTFTMESVSQQTQIVKCTAVICVPGLTCSKVLTNDNCAKEGVAQYYGYSLEGHVPLY